MHQPKIRWKRSSFARRILLTSLALLVFPLLLHTFFLYREEYQQTLEDVHLTVRVIGEAQKALLEERFELIWNMLDVIEQPSSDLRIAEMPLPSGMQGHFALLDPQKQLLLIGQEKPDHRALVLATPLPDLLYQLTHFEDAPFPIFVALVDPRGKILSGEQKGNAITENFSLAGAQFSLLLTAPLAQIQHIHRSEVLFRFLTLIALIAILGGGIVWFLMRRLNKPLQTFRLTMQRVSEGAAHVRYTPDRLGFEINELGSQFNDTLDALVRYQQEAEREKAHRERLAQELKIGHEIQASLLPTHLPEAKELDIAPGFLPAREVGGDFYDLFALDDGSIFLAIADTAGKGISACLYALGLRSSLRALASHHADLADIVLRANDLFWIDAQNTGMFITLWAAIYNPKTRLLTYCCQGHVPALLKRGDSLQELTTSGIAMGAQKLTTVTTHQMELAAHDLLLLYTDGITEAHDPYGDRYGMKRLTAFLLRRKSTSSSELVEQLLEDVHLYAQGVPQHDDMTLLALRIF